ncbi:MAG: cytochrome c oxidase assembly protein [Rhizomicrobium sp.]
MPERFSSGWPRRDRCCGPACRDCCCRCLMPGRRAARWIFSSIRRWAPVLFVGLLYFWLLPAIHTRVMLDANLYGLMNWTMAINGVMFWSLVLDPRPKPPARYSHLMRAAMILIIELPQMVLGAILSLSTSDYYPVYEICGRILPMTALNDQHYGGLIIWLPGTLTSFAAMIVVLWTMRVNEERAEHAQQTV